MNVIAEITDDMFEIEPIPFNNPKVRYGARGIVKTQDGLIAVFFKTVYIIYLFLRFFSFLYCAIRKNNPFFF